MNKKIITKQEGYEISSVSLIGQQLELFTSSNKINLTNLYARIVKSVNAERKKKIVWESKNLAQPLTIPFLSENDKPLLSTITPALIEDSNNPGVYKSMFPEMREDRIELAIVQLMTKSELHIEYEGNRVSSTYISITPYQIRKEIVESINEREHRNLSVNDCGYSTADVVESLRILKGSQITVINEKGKKEYQFNRIKDLYLDDDKRQVVEVNTMITNSISNENYIPFDRALIAPSTELQSALVLYMHLNWRGLKKDDSIGMFAVNLMKLVDYPFNENISISKNISAFLKVFKSMAEVETIEINADKTKKEGRTVVDRFMIIDMSKYFFDKVITANKVNKRNREHVKTKKGLLIKPLEEEFGTKSEYQEAIKTYHTKL